MEAVETLLSVGSVVAFQSLKFFKSKLEFEPQITEIYTEKTIKSKTLSVILGKNLQALTNRVNPKKINPIDLIEKFKNKSDWIANPVNRLNQSINKHTRGTLPKVNNCLKTYLLA